MVAALDETHSDALIVGSGFGGAVMAARLAAAGLGVRLLERGRAYPPGSFPRSPRAIRDNLWDPVGGRFGLFDVRSFRHLDALVASGLGGGSLIYANVLLRKEERWFVQEDLRHGGYEYWPITRAELDPHYDRVEAMLRPVPYPFHLDPYAGTPKTRAFRAAAERLGLHPFLPPLAVTFADDDGVCRLGEPFGTARDNLHGRTRLTCRLCGECDIGCNYGSKNTLDFTYLSAAQRAGADLRTGCEVTALEPRSGGGYTVHYAEHPGGRVTTATADRVILAAGALGSTRLLLRSQGALPGLSPALGSRFGGNGDLLMFATGWITEHEGRRVPMPIDPSYGPVITAALRIGDDLDGEGWWEAGDPEEDWEGEGGAGRGFYLEDGGFPDSVAWLLLAAATPGTLRRLVGESVRGRAVPTRLREELLRLLEPAERSADLLPLLAMGRDLPDGHLSLRDGELDVAWTRGTAGRYFHRIRATARRMAAALGGHMLDNPQWLLGRLTTVHPLGGCPMGRDPREGVVDANGEVFGHPGLYVADGAVMPGPVGANPSLTIAALADRFADRLLESARRAD